MLFILVIMHGIMCVRYTSVSTITYIRETCMCLFTIIYAFHLYCEACVPVK